MPAGVGRLQHLHRPYSSFSPWQVQLALLNSTQCEERLLGEFPVFGKGQNICAAGGCSSWPDPRRVTGLGCDAAARVAAGMVGQAC